MRRVGAAPEALLWRTPQWLDIAGEHSFAMLPWAGAAESAGWLAGWRGAPWASAGVGCVPYWPCAQGSRAARSKPWPTGYSQQVGSRS